MCFYVIHNVLGYTPVTGPQDFLRCLGGLANKEISALTGPSYLRSLGNPLNGLRNPLSALDITPIKLNYAFVQYGYPTFGTYLHEWPLVH